MRSTRIGWVVGVLPALFLLVDGAMKLAQPRFVIDATVRLGYPESVPLGGCAMRYLVPATSFLGAILLTGYLGGAVATHVRVGAGAFEVLFPVFLGALLWGGLVLRDDRLRALIQWRTSVVSKNTSSTRSHS